MKNKNITIFIENDSHLRFIKNLIDALMPNNCVTIVSLEEIKNKTKFKENQNVKIVKNTKELISFLMNLECDYFFTTTPGLNKSNFPKSKVFPKSLRPKYIYLFHSLVSPNEMYVNNSFNYFDYVISPSEIVSKQLKYLISPKTQVLSFGYVLFDNLEKFKFKTYEDKVLIAPSWGDEGLAKQDNLINQLVNKLKTETNEIVFRPHPMDLKRVKQNPLKGVILDLELDLNQLESYKYLVTDCSGIALEFFFLTGRPTLFVDVPKKIKRKIKSKEKELLFIEDKMKEILGTCINLRENSLESIIPKIPDLKAATSFIDEVCMTKDVVKKIISYEY